jgi:hypothetical protein
MTSDPLKITPNPLAAFMRQPKIYIKLPSQGKFWPNGSLEVTETGEYPVYSMTARDELMLKIPDAVMSGQAVVDVIQNCMPHIKNAWHIPAIDLDIILIGLRLATYGEIMETPITVGENEFTCNVDLRQVLDSLYAKISWEDAISINDNLTVFVKPLTYKHISEAALKSFETQKIMSIVGNDEISEEEKIKAFKESFNKLTEVTISIVQNSVYKIDSSAGSTDNPQHIKEFVNNIDKQMFNTIQNFLETQKANNAVPNLTITTPQDIKDKGYTEDKIEVPLVFDPSTFFV